MLHNIPHPHKLDIAEADALLNELPEHRNPMGSADHLWMHRYRQHTPVDMLMHPSHLGRPDLQHLAWR